jgi:hypothetical protein
LDIFYEKNFYFIVFNHLALAQNDNDKTNNVDYSDLVKILGLQPYYNNDILGQNQKIIVIDAYFDTENSRLKPAILTTKFCEQSKEYSFFLKKRKEIFYNLDNKIDTEFLKEEIDEYKETLNLIQHGTSMLSLIRALAPKAKIIPVEYGLLEKSKSYIQNLIEFAKENKVSVVSMSIGFKKKWNQDQKGYVTNLINRWISDFNKAGIPCIKSAGNNGLVMGDDAHTEKLINKDNKGEDLFLFVGNLHYSNQFNEEKLHDSSERSGKCSDYISAPGTNIITYSFQGKETYVTGTSCSTPIVAACFLLAKQLLEKYSSVEKLKDVISLLKKHARKNFKGGNVISKYIGGSGILDMEDLYGFTTL